ncbi:MAG: DedA family protein [Paludibacteraceae bacterium]|nr:DedA family protein [Paludibacteraceae bacterium]MBP6285170.1 DedA family protein [Paludibacteraceae bacterium]
MQTVEKWYEQNMNYYTITALMTIESSFIPFPSEIVIPPAAYIASKEDSPLNIVLVVVFGTLGAILGALINYYLAKWLGRKVIYSLVATKLGGWLLLSPEKVEKAEHYFNKNGSISTFIGRLIPGIRQLISIPAGLAKMNLFSFILYTTLGAGIWNIVLAVIGYAAHGQQDLIEEYSHELSILIVLLGGVFVLFLALKLLRKRLAKKVA